MPKLQNEIPFHPVVQNWFSSQFKQPSPPQKAGWPEIAAGRNTLILSPTGSGKTLAAFLWCINDLLQKQIENDQPFFTGVHTLYISPLKALNNDIQRNLEEPLAGINAEAEKVGLPKPDIKTLVRTGDTPTHVRQAMVKKPPQILITTPESLYLLLTSAKGREIFFDLRYLIVDEIHAICDGKRGVHLSLSLERLMPLCKQEPIRIGLSATQRPLERIAAFLGGQKFDPDKNRHDTRPVKIIDCGQKKQMDVKVVSPVSDFSDLPESTVWPAVIDKLYELITTHETTLVFVNMRVFSEKVARLLNEQHQRVTRNPEAVLALSHHGSISREQRYEVEARLKSGDIPAVIATGSLELGIDIGSIDLVVQLEAPRTVTSAMQRVGRSGHVLGAVSKGRIIPMYPSDLDDTVTIAQLMQQSDIEETQIPENCLDVLAQQIVAELSAREWPRLELFYLVQQSFCYKNLSQSAFDHVLEMLAGRYADTPLRSLQPRINWDRVNERLIALKGARLHAVMNGGTIPDRGYYAVYLSGSNTRLGEMEEEFVFESRVGNVFFLGNNEWKIEKIQQDRIVVSPVKSVKPRPPFWKGDLLYRRFESSSKIGAFRRMVGEFEDDSALAEVADEAVIKNLRHYLNRQKEATKKLPTDKTIIGEWFRDSSDEPHLILHTCFGARVNGLWAIALAATLEQRFSVQVQYTVDDDGLILRALDTADEFPIETLLKLTPQEAEEVILNALIDTPVFAVRFRYNAARALILPRSQPGKRIPLWLQRLRAADLLQVVRQYPDFPIIAETYRDCLYEVFDLPALKVALNQILSGEIQTHFVHTPSPSPMAAGLIFDFLASNLYNEDRTRLPGQMASLNSELLADILNKENIPALVTPETIAEAEARWQHMQLEFQAKDEEGLYIIIEKLAPVSTKYLKKRAKVEIQPLLENLANKNRILQKEKDLWIPVFDSKLFDDDLSQEAMTERVRRVLRIHGPLTSAEIKNKLGFKKNKIEQALDELHLGKEIVTGQLVLGSEEITFCDRHNFAELYRRAISLRRQKIKPADRPQFLKFQLAWHKVGAGGSALEAIIEQYRGCWFPQGFFQRDILRNRTAELKPGELNTKLEELVQSGMVILRARRNELKEAPSLLRRGFRGGSSGRTQFAVFPRGSGSLFFEKEKLEESEAGVPAEAGLIFSFLKENGASFMRDISSGANLSSLQMQKGLQQLAVTGLVGCESQQAFLAMINAESQPEAQSPASWGQRGLPEQTKVSGTYRTRGRIRRLVKTQIDFGSSRWFLMNSFAFLGKPVETETRILQQARLLLRRHGILVKEWYRHESGLVPWYEIFRTLKRLEWQGEIRRGYFIEGLSGVQFALPEAVSLLENIQTGDTKPSQKTAMLSAIDPALPFGGSLSWDLEDANGDGLTIKRLASNHIVFAGAVPILYSENYGNRLWFLRKISDAEIETCISLLKNWLTLPTNLRPRKKIKILQIDDEPATQFTKIDLFVKNGFERSGEKLVLWPSGV